MKRSADEACLESGPSKKQKTEPVEYKVLASFQVAQLQEWQRLLSTTAIVSELVRVRFDSSGICWTASKDEYMKVEVELHYSYFATYSVDLPLTMQLNLKALEQVTKEIIKSKPDMLTFEVVSEVSPKGHSRGIRCTGRVDATKVGFSELVKEIPLSEKEWKHVPQEDIPLLPLNPLPQRGHHASVYVQFGSAEWHQIMARREKAKAKSISLTLDANAGCLELNFPGTVWQSTVKLERDNGLVLDGPMVAIDGKGNGLVLDCTDVKGNGSSVPGQSSSSNQADTKPVVLEATVPYATILHASKAYRLNKVMQIYMPQKKRDPLVLQYILQYPCTDNRRGSHVRLYVRDCTL